MKAMLLTRIGPVEDKCLELVGMPKPEPKENEVLVKVSVCGACHTDLDEAEGRLTPTMMPIVPGHQVVGTVNEKGKSVARFKIGQRVGITWLYWACGQCSFCKSGNENLCDNAKWTGKDANGGYAEYIVIDENFVYPLPESFTDAQVAPLLCAGVIGYRTLRLAKVNDKQIIGLYGFGACAHILIQVIKYKFPNNPVFVFTKTQEHAELAKSLGADWTGRSSDNPPAKLNIAIDFTPVGQCVRDALEALERGGRLVINAIRKETVIPELEYAKYLWFEKEIKSVANVTRTDAEEFLPLAAQIPITSTIEEFSLEDANEVLIRIKHSKLRAAAVLRI
ncbi:MAG: zinc-dependent alcohol dehydrogenase family protein [Planctomycetes bacterium]|nr:zinc-dependent alcohol dehydrogenase family protein [Planctomycetota bacterium]